VTLRTKIYIAAAVLSFLLVVAGLSTLWSDRRIAKFERESEAARFAAEQSETRAAELERQAAAYEQKIEFLEGSLSDQRSIAAKQDEDLKTFKNNTDNARRDVDRARAARSLESTTAELCSKLAELGHPCE
jgi:uncharacterized coiled-coil protein SlyX